MCNKEKTAEIPDMMKIRVGESVKVKEVVKVGIPWFISGVAQYKMAKAIASLYGKVADSEKITPEQDKKTRDITINKKNVDEWEKSEKTNFAGWAIDTYLNIKKGFSKTENMEWFNKNKMLILGHKIAMVEYFENAIKAIVKDEMDFAEIKFRFLDKIDFEAIETVDYRLKGKIEKDKIDNNADEVEKKFYDEEWCPYYWSREYIKYIDEGGIDQRLANLEQEKKDNIKSE